MRWKHYSRTNIIIMKNLMKLPSTVFLCLMFLLGNKAYSQTATCKNIVNIYPGPQNSQQLAYLFNTSSNPLITALSCSTKTSLESYIVFNNGLPGYMSDTDANINAIYADTSYCRKLFSAIFGVTVKVCTYATKPTVTSITLAAFHTLIGSGTSGCLSFWPVLSQCTNCYSNNPLGDDISLIGQCCEVGGSGCWDSMVDVNGTYYYITQ